MSVASVVPRLAYQTGCHGVDAAKAPHRAYDLVGVGALKGVSWRTFFDDLASLVMDFAFSVLPLPALPLAGEGEGSGAPDAVGGDFTRPTPRYEASLHRNLERARKALRELQNEPKRLQPAEADHQGHLDYLPETPRSTSQKTPE